ncbi:very short patch repair endonuclease [Paenibacillus sp. M1]|uniref:Very short patch repair endonuclease n=1 Tax=Paenibacillus haidiansis TaxID=1574488 RepID=A0ABU7VXY2_9BACL
MDSFSKEKRSQIMSNVKSKNTTPELIVRRLLHRMGYRFRLHRPDLPGKPDIVLPKYKKVIFINGCFWHGHENCKKSQLPKTNREFWQSKIRKNKSRDEKSINKLLEMGWQCLVIWDCQIKKKDIEKLVIILEGFMKGEMDYDNI